MKKLLICTALILIATPSMAFATSIDINSATASQLDLLEGIGPSYAAAIIAERPFVSVEDLVRVKGIGDKTVEKIKTQGFACINCSTSIPHKATVLPKAKKSGTN